ncbi:Protein tyrosine kinase [Rhizoctonia solani]|uniref:Protein tyrosine kinase n=1 Tax=Rhizoctonia solani TaxID=456999 RepID=A0A8H7H4J6_9AGAM|nr:Protein tyrosine kinase [Rhizoctonia solani]
MKGELSEAKFFRAIRDVLRGIVYLHTHNPPIAHGCINPGKVYMRGETAKLGEFGLSQLVSDFPHLVPSITVGSITRWMCPEYFDKTGPGSTTIQGDVWSFGCTLLEITTGFIPYHQSKLDAQVVTKIVSGIPPGNIKSQPVRNRHNLSTKSIELMQSLITQCWLPIMERLSSEDLLSESIDESLRFLIDHNITDTTLRLNLPNRGLSSVAHGSRSNVCTTWLNNGTQVAVKMLLPEFGYKEDKTNKRSLSGIYELYIWSNLNHPNILPLIGAAVYRNNLAIVSPWMNNGNFQDYMRRGHMPSTRDRLNLVRSCAQVTEGLSYMHSVGIIHGDIKGGKILISDEGIPRICGFGQATIINPDSELQFEYVPSEYTSRWAAPELFTDEEVSKKPASDVYSLGMEIVTGSIPWADKTEHAVFGALMSGNLPERSHQHFPLQDRWANLTWSLLTQCWDMDPAKRPTVAEVGSKLKEIVAELPVSVGRE